MDKYDLQYNGQSIGFVEVEKAGCFYRFFSRFTSREKTQLHLVVHCNTLRYDLGLCVQYKDQYGTEKRVPIRQIGEGPMTFLLENIDVFVPIFEEEPFAYLDKLINSRFEKRYDTKGILLRQEN